MNPFIVISDIREMISMERGRPTDISNEEKLDLQSIGSSPDLHILCAHDTIMIPFRTKTWDSFLRLGVLGLTSELSFRRYSATTDHEELPYVLDLAVHLVHLDR